MKIEKHLIKLKQSFRAIDNAIKQGLTDNERDIGIHTSLACADMFEILLHKKNLINIGATIKHEWFASKNKMKEKFTFDLEGKEELLEMIHKIESKRNDLTYGAPHDEEMLEEIINLFNNIKTKFKELGLNEI